MIVFMENDLTKFMIIPGMYKEPSKTKLNKSQNPPYRCLPCHGKGGGGGLTQDLTLILSTKKHQAKQNKENQNPRKNSSTTKEVERDLL